MERIEVIDEGNGQVRILIDGVERSLRNPTEWKAMTLDVRDRDWQFYNQLMSSENFRRALDDSYTASDLLDAVSAFVDAWRRRRHGA